MCTIHCKIYEIPLMLISHFINQVDMLVNQYLIIFGKQYLLHSFQLLKDIDN